MKEDTDTTSFDTSSDVPEVQVVEKRRRGRPRKNEYQQPQHNPNYMPMGYQYVVPRQFPITMGYNNSLYKQPSFKYYTENPLKGGNNVYLKGAYIYSYNQAPYAPITIPAPSPPVQQNVSPAPPIKKEKKKKRYEEEEDDEFQIEEELDQYEKLLAQDDDRFLVKFRNKSYLHCDWVDQSELVTSRAAAMKIKRFKPKEVPFDPEYLKVDRIITEENDNYFVKWKSLPYESATWESKDDLAKVENFAEEKEQFYDRRNVARTSLPMDWRPNKEYFLKFTESPTFKNNNTLRSYQLEGLNWLLNRWFYKQSCIMADEMGLGKTVQSVSFVNTLYTKYNYTMPVLIVSPLSTIIHWEREFKNWTDLRVIVFHGTAAGRQIISDYELYLKGRRLFDVLITTYETVMSSLRQFQEINFSIGIFDEAHRLKNSNSKAVQCLKAVYFNHKILLSGTPLQNNLSELWSLLNFISPQQFSCINSFLEEFKLEKSEDVERLQQVLKPIMLRRMKEDVEKSIPLKEETIIEVELTMIQKRYYRAILEKNLEFLRKNNSENAPNLLNAMMEIRKCCIHPYLIKGAEESIVHDYIEQKKKRKEEASIELLENNKEDINLLYKELQVDEHYKVLINSSGKLVLLDKLLQKLQGSHKVLIFSQMTKCLDLLADYLNYRQYKYERIDGGIRGDARQAAIDRFSTTDVFVFLLCTRAGGVGINLTAADTVIIFDSDWNPQNDLQAQARCHRIGQTQEVKIYRLVTRNTYEREMFDKAGLKLGLDRAVLQKMSFDKETVLKKKDAVEILLKKGAYGVLMETDEASRKFCEEDIDQILERRTKIIKHQDGGNVFSKASFQVDEEIDDPDFWENLLSKKEKQASEGRVKRIIRKLAREGNLSNEEKESIDKELKTLLDNYDDLYGKDKASVKDDHKQKKIKTNIQNTKDNNSISESEEENGLQPKDDSFLKERIVFLMLLRKGIKSLATLKFDYSEIVQLIYSYCLSKILVKKHKEDLMMFLDIKEEKMVDFTFYDDWCIKLLLRVQVPIILQALLKQTNLTGEKSKGFSLEDDKRLVNYTLSHGYDNYPTSTGNEKGFFKGKNTEDLNQRVRRIILNLNLKIESIDGDSTDPSLVATILQFGKCTERNKDVLLDLLGEEKLEEYNSVVDQILEKKKKGKRRDAEEQLLFDRICLFSAFFNMEEIPIIKKRLNKKWNNETDYKLKDRLECFGLTEEIVKEFNVTEDAILLRIRELIDKSYELSE